MTVGYSSPSSKMQLRYACLNFGDVFIPTHPSVCRDHMSYTTVGWYMTWGCVVIGCVRQSIYKVSDTLHSVGDFILTIYTCYKTKFSAASVCLSVCLQAINSKTTARIFMRFSPIDSNSSGKFWYIFCQGCMWIGWNITINIGSGAKKWSRLGAFI